LLGWSNVILGANSNTMKVPRVVRLVSFLLVLLCCEFLHFLTPKVIDTVKAQISQYVDNHDAQTKILSTPGP
jgi:hypothetical protein